MTRDYYELRYIETSVVNSGAFSLFDDEEDRITLLDFIMKNDKVFLLGNPGVGKTTELKFVFERLWSKIDQDQLIPIYVNIKTFRTVTRIEELIVAENWQNLPSIMFIFDGLDEIADIQDFISELENFIWKYKGLRIKYLISCRTNIYEKYLIEIDNFEVAYLKYLSVNQIKSILTNKYNIDTSDLKIESLESVLQTPFNLDLFAEYYLENGSFPATLEQSLELSSISEAQRAKKKLIKRFRILESQILNSCKKVAISAELMQRNYLSEPELIKILEEDFINVFQELPFIEIKDGKFNFRHKIYQEYFAAKYISELEFNEIIRLIAADELNKVKPSLFNAVTFLLNVLEGKKFELLRDWLFKNDIELLFFADDNRLTIQLQNQVFKTYYEDHCINKSFWLNNNGKIKTDILAKYADFEFLLDEIKNDERLERSRVSLIEILPYKILSLEEQTMVKDLYRELFHNKKTSDFFKSEILRAIKISEYYKDDSTFWNEILELSIYSDDNAISHQLISIFSNIPDNERDNNNLLQIVKNHFKPQEDRVIRGTEQIVGNIMLQTYDAAFFLELIKILFDDTKTLKIESIYSLNFKEELIKKIQEFSKDSDFKNSFLKFCFANDARLFNQEDFLSLVINSIGISSDEMLSLITDPKVQERSLYSLSRFFTESSINVVSQAFSNDELEFADDKNIQSIRNWMSHYNRDLALLWQQKFLDNGYKFSELLYSDQQINEFKENFDIFRKRNFDILFDREEFKKEIQAFFVSNEIDEIEQPEFQKLFWRWYEVTGYHGLSYSIHVLIEKAFQSVKKLTAELLISLLDNEYIHLSVIKSILTHNSAAGYALSEHEKKVLTELANKLETQIDYENAVIVNSTEDERFSITKHQKYIETLLFFDVRFNILRSDNFYLNVLDKGNLIGSSTYNEESNFVDYIKSRINDPAVLDNIVIQNIREKKLLYLARKDHFEYAINNDLKECFPTIEKQLIESDFLFFSNDLIERFLEKNDNPVDFLKSCCTEVTSYLCWNAIKILKEKYLEKDFCLNIARKYLAEGHSDYLHKAINILFYCNQADSLFYYDKMLNKMIDSQGGDSSGYLPPDASNYSHTNEVELVEQLFYTIFIDTNNFRFYLNRSREFMRALVAVFGGFKEGYEHLKPILFKIKEDVKGKDVLSFYINNLIEIFENAYLKVNSKEVSIEEVIRVLK